MGEAFTTARMPIEGRPTGLWQQTGGLTSCYPSSCWFFQPRLRRRLQRNVSGVAAVTYH